MTRKKQVKTQRLRVLLGRENVPLEEGKHDPLEEQVLVDETHVGDFEKVKKPEEI